MKLITISNLKSFYNILLDSFVSPYAKKDDEGNMIKDTYLRKDEANKLVREYAGTPDNAKHADKATNADTAAVCTGNAATATKLETARKISVAIDGGAASETTFDGTSDVSLSLANPSSKEVNSFFRQPNTSYSVGDIVYVKGVNMKYRLSCVTAGTTGADELSTSLEVGIYITDGTVLWIIEDTTQSDAVGDITLHPTLLAGHVLADGATVKASEYPRLLAWVQENSMTGTDDAHYTYDASADTLKLPNAQGRVLQGGKAISAMEAGLPEIWGRLQTLGIDQPASIFPEDTAAGGAVFHQGAFTTKGNVQDFNNTRGISSHETVTHPFKLSSVLTFYASKYNAIYGASATVQPPAITLLAQIKY